MRMSRRFGPWLVAGVLALAAAPAHANHIPGATYTGTAATGGSVSFDVSALGGAVTRFAWSDVPTDCGVSSGNVRGSLPIVDHAFWHGQFRPPSGPGFRGSLPTNQQATGGLGQGTGRFGTGCGFSVGWTATTTAIAPPPPASDEIPPAIDVRAEDRLRRDGELKVWVGSPEEPCLVTVGGAVSAAGGGRTFRLRRDRTRLAHGANVEFGNVPVNPDANVASEPQLRPRALAAVRRALKNGRRVEARVTVVAVDAAGNRAVERATIRLHR
jgi:hypothetical protein